MLEPRALDEWVRSYVARQPDIQAVILAGSRAYGDALPSSDIDLCVVLQGVGAEFRRERTNLDQYPVEIMCGTWGWYDDVIERYERASNVGTITEMLARGILLWGGGEHWEDVRRRARASFHKGPDPADAQQREVLTRAHLQLENRWVRSAGAERQWLWHALVREAAGALFVLRGWWAVKPHRKLGTIREKDPVLYSLLVDALASGSGTVAIAQRLRSQVFGVTAPHEPDSDVKVRAITAADRERVRALLVERWGSVVMMAGGVSYRVDELPALGAFLGDELVGLLTYARGDREMEIISLDSLRPGRGIGGALLAAVQATLRWHHLERIRLVTSNDNLHALGFYLSRGFRLTAVHLDAVTQARLVKPEIPLVGDRGIAIRDEWELWWVPEA